MAHVLHHDTQWRPLGTSTEHLDDVGVPQLTQNLDLFVEVSSNMIYKNGTSITTLEVR